MAVLPNTLVVLNMQHLFNIEPFTKISKRDYLIVIPPEHHMGLKMMYYKLKAWELIGNYPSLHSKAYVTVNHDTNIQALVFEEKLVYYKRKLPCINAFEIKVCGFGKFKHQENSYTIFAKVEIDPVVQETLSVLNRTFSKSTAKMPPHMAIAKNISKEKADLLWQYFVGLEFEYSFYAHKVSVLETPTRKFFNLPMRVKAEIGLAAAS